VRRKSRRSFRRGPSSASRIFSSERRPNVTPARVSNSDVLLTGIVRCECCGAPLMVRTEKSGRYRYYACARTG